MADTLPDVPADLWNNWSADQFMQSVQDKLAGVPGEIATGVQAMAPPPPPIPQAGDTEPALGAPVANAVVSPAPPPPAPPPPDMPPPAPDLGSPPPAPAAAAPPPPPPPALPPMGVSPSPQQGEAQPQSDFDPISTALNAAQSSGADMQQFGSTLSQHLSQSPDYFSAALNAAHAAGADMQQFGSSLSSAMPSPPQPQPQDQPQPLPPAVDPGMGAPVTDPSQASYAGAAARQSQFGLGLSSGDAMAFCGPTAAMAFAQTYGRNPTVDEAKALAQQAGWNPNQGMAGVGSEVNLLKDMGIDAHATQGVDWSQVQQSATSGNPVIIDTPGHYYYVDGFNQQTGQYHVGTSGTDLKGGSEWMTQDQIANMPQSDGAPRAAVYADHPLGDGNPVTNVLGQAGQGLSNLGQALGLQGPQSQQPGDLVDIARQAAAAAGIDPEIFTRQIQQESGFNPNAKSGAGAEGIAQFMPQTAQGVGIDPMNPIAALQAAAQMDAQNLTKYGGDWAKALAAYNAGGGNVDKYGGVPPFAETQSYVNNILGGAQNAVQQLGQGVQQAGQNAWQGIQNTAQDLFQGAQSQLDPLSQQLLNSAAGIGQGAQDLLSQGGNAISQLDPLSQQLLSAAGSALGGPTITPEQALAQGQSLDYSVNPMDLIPGNGGLGVPGVGTSTTGDTLEQTIANWIAQNNPARDVPVLGGATTAAAQLATNPTNLALMASGLEPGAALGDLLSDPSVLNALRYRQAGEINVNAALGGIPAALGLGEQPAATTGTRILNEAGQLLGTSEAPMSTIFARATGSDLLQRALDTVGAYPEEISTPLLQTARDLIGAGQDSSRVASTLLRWAQENPLGGQTLPDVATATGAELRDAGTQAVQDIAQAVRGNVGGGMAGYLPQGTMPGQLGLLPGTSFQPIMEEGAGSNLESLLSNLPAGDRTYTPGLPQGPGSNLESILADLQSGDRTYTPGLPRGQGLLEQILNPAYGVEDRARLAQLAAQGRWQEFQQQIAASDASLQASNMIGNRIADVRGMIPGFEDAMYGNAGGTARPLSNLPGMLPEATSAGTNIDQFLHALYQDYDPTFGQVLPKGVTSDMVQQAHAYIDQLGNLAGTPHTDLNNMLAQGASPAEIERFFAGLEGQTGFSWTDLLHQVRTGSLAGGLNTEGKVALGPIIQAAMRAPTGAIKLMLQGRGGDIPLGLQGGLDGLAEGAREGLQTLKYGTNYRNVLTRNGPNPGLDVTGANPAVRALGTALTGLVRTHGAIGDVAAGIGRGANEALGASAADAAEAGQQWAFRSGEYGHIGGGIANAMGALRRANPALDVMTQLVMPFYRTGYNVFTQGVEHSPVGFAGRLWDAAEGKPLDQGKLVNNLFGTGLAVLAFKEAADGNITGDAPVGGAPKQSMRVPGIGWVPLRTLGPASEPLAQAAALYESSRDNRGDIGGMATQLGSEYIKHVTDETWLSSLADAMNTLSAAGNLTSPTGRTNAQNELGYQLKSYGKSLIPQEKLAEQVLGALNLGPGAKAAPTGRQTISSAGRQTLPTTRPTLPSPSSPRQTLPAPR